jgi:acetyl esterase/lipase
MLGTPATRHSGRECPVLANRHEVYTAAKRRTPRRWTGPLATGLLSAPCTSIPSSRRCTSPQLRLQSGDDFRTTILIHADLVAQTSNIFKATYKSVDAADELSSRPDFAVALYPGHLCRSGAALDPSIDVTKQTPPTFLLQAWDDPVDRICNSTVYAHALAKAGVPSEVHLFAKGGHGFGLRGKEHPVSSWPSLVEHWLEEIGILNIRPG